LRIAFMGTPDFSVLLLHALVDAGHEIAAVYCQPPRPAGRRGLELTKSPVQQAAEGLGLPVYTPHSLRGEEEQARFQALGLDVAVVAAYGLLLPKAVLDAPCYGCFNAHASLLPRWRGAAPVQRAIMAGDTETGMMIMKMDEGLDTGAVACAEKVAIGQDMTAGELHDRLSRVAADLMVQALAALEAGRLELFEQSRRGVTYAHKISKEETRIDWHKPAMAVHKHICGLSPFPGAWCEMDITGKKERVKILQSQFVQDVQGKAGQIDPESLMVFCADGAVKLVRLQRAGSKPLDERAFMRGASVKAVF